MGKEYWLCCYDVAVEDICEENSVDWDEGEKILLNLLDQNPRYLDGYITYD